MGRPEAPLDPSASPLAAFAHSLRELRRGAGEPTYAAMERRSGKSATVLSDAASGRKMPTWPTVEAYVNACGGDSQEWRPLWEALRDAGAGVVVSPAGVGPTTTDSTSTQRDGEVATTEIRLTGRRRIRARHVLIAGLLVAVTLLMATVIYLRWPGRDTDRGWTAPTVLKDGADPEDSGCASDPAEYQLNDAEVDYNGLPAGSAQLKYSPGCGVAWARFQPFPQADIPKHISIHVDIVRPADNQRSAFDAPYVGAPVYGNVLFSTSNCVYAAVWIGDHQGNNAEVHTHCFRGRTFVR